MTKTHVEIAEDLERQKEDALRKARKAERDGNFYLKEIMTELAGHLDRQARKRRRLANQLGQLELSGV